MKRLHRALMVAVLTLYGAIAAAQVSATANGGAGGSGGSASGGTASGGTAAGGTATNTNNTTSGTSSATGGTSSALGGNASSAGGTANVGSATSNYQGADVSVNYTTPAGAAGINGLAAGVDPATGHVVTDNNVRYSGTTKIKNTPDVNIGGPASGTCNGLSGGVGVGLPGMSVGANVSTVDKGCEARETARIAAMLGRMDVANAVLENMDVVMSAMKARADRDARAATAADAVAANARLSRDAETAALQAARNREAEAMQAQQQAGIDALGRQATMQKVNDTLTFTGKLTNGEEKTPQQLMAEQLAARPAAATVGPGAPAALASTTPAPPAPAGACASRGSRAGGYRGKPRNDPAPR